MDDDSLSDPVVALYEEDPNTGEFDRYHSQTEHIENEHEPRFQKFFILDTFRDDDLKFSVYDVDDNQVIAACPCASTLRTLSPHTAPLVGYGREAHGVCRGRSLAAV